MKKKIKLFSTEATGGFRQLSKSAHVHTLSPNNTQRNKREKRKEASTEAELQASMYNKGIKVSNRITKRPGDLC